MRIFCIKFWNFKYFWLGHSPPTRHKLGSLDVFIFILGINLSFKIKLEKHLTVKLRFVNSRILLLTFWFAKMSKCPFGEFNIFNLILGFNLRFGEPRKYLKMKSRFVNSVMLLMTFWFVKIYFKSTRLRMCKLLLRREVMFLNRLSESDSKLFCPQAHSLEIYNGGGSVLVAVCSIQRRMLFHVLVLKWSI